MSRSRRNAKADEYFRRAPNYSAEAIPRLLARAARHKTENPRTSAALTAIAEMLFPAHKFVLPNGGRLFDRTTEAMTDVRLPFQFCAFEFTFDFIAISPMTEAAMHCDAAIVLASEIERGISIFHILRSKEEGWRAGLDHILLPTDEKGGFVVQGLGEYADKVGESLSSDDHLEAQRPFAEIVAQACAALSCTNVTTELIRPNREARAARPESTLFDYHVLMIRPGVERHEGNPLGGSHASPRTHLRRGHIRQHPTAGRIWVNSCVVNPTAIGTVNKDYEIVPRKK